MANHKNVGLVTVPIPDRYVRAADRRGTNLWRIPVGICIVVLFVFSITIGIDTAADSGRILLPHWLSVGGYEDTQSLLSAIMGAVSTVVALVFSVTLLVFSIAESQLGRVLCTVSLTTARCSTRQECF